MKSHLSTKSLNALKKALPHGSVKAIAERMNLDASTVSKVLDGKSNNLEVIEVALQVAKEAKAKRRDLENRITELS